MTRVLVTGGGGFLGSAIVAQLHRRGDEVRSFSRGLYPALEEMGVEQIRGDLTDERAVSEAASGMDVIIHCAAKPPPWGRRSDYEAVNIAGTARVIEACRHHDVECLVYTSTPSVVASGSGIEGGDERLPYGTHFLGAEYPRTKAVAEQQVLRADGSSLQGGGQLRTVALRPHLIWGPGDPHFLPRFLQKRRSGRLKRIGHTDPLVDPTYVDNAAEAHVLAADKLLGGGDIGGKAYFISNDERIGLWEMLDRMLVAAGETPVEGRVSARVVRFAASILESVWRRCGLSGEPPITRFVAHRVTTPRWFDISAAKRDLGYQPAVSLEEGMARLATWCQQYPL